MKNRQSYGDNNKLDPHQVESNESLLEHLDREKVWLPDLVDSFIRVVGHVVCWFNAALLVFIMAQVVLRYGFSNGQIALEELQWHFYSTAVMVGLSYALVNDTHVRVDIFYSRFSDPGKRIIDIISVLFFILPFTYVIFYHSLPFVADAWRVNEASDSSDGLPYRFVIKSVIPISFGLLGLAALSRLMRDCYLLMKRT